VPAPDREEPAELEELLPEAEQESDAFWEQACVQNVRRALRLSKAPAMLLDLSLRIRWVNEAYSASFGTGAPPEGRSLLAHLADSLTEERRGELLRLQRLPPGNLSWYARLEIKVPGRLPVISTVLIVPLFGSLAPPPAAPAEPPAEGTPAGFQAHFHDISEEYRRMLRGTYESLLEAARLKDNDTGYHIQRVNRYCSLLAEKLAGLPGFPQVDADFLQNIAFLAAMHDVGKIGTPDDILNKEGPLEDWQREVMKAHTINGAYILASYPNPMARDIALRHHERWDGTGYPHGLNGEQIPLAARIVALADVYDALRMRRPYKAPLTHPQAAEKILQSAGSHFDPSLAEVFRRHQDRFAEIYLELAEE
jgi:putative two-component system response regulator